MISRLHGQLLLEKTSVTVLVHDVGYAVQLSEKTLAQLQPEQIVTFFIYTHVRENAIELYGFLTAAEQELFTLLIAISGVGPKTALGLLNLSTSQITTAVQNGEVSVFTTVPRVGKKLAQKIIIELRSKLGALRELDLAPLSAVHAEVREALLTLGFSEKLIDDRLRTLPFDNLDVPTAVKLAIQSLSKK